MITLYYIPGISRSDTPVFSTVVGQNNYFSSYVPNKTNIDTGFYPPHYRNTIDISAEDFDQVDNCNYLSLVYKNKTYYYFVDSVMYVNESLVKLIVTMDTVQTYMFDVKFLKYERTRKLIARWVNDKINRNYLRENVSQGLFQQYSRKNYLTRADWDYAPYGGDITGLYVVKYSEKLSQWETPGKITLDIEIPTRPGSQGFSSYYTYVLPEVDHKLEDKDTTINFQTSITKNFFTCVNESSQDPKAVEIYYVPFCNIAGLTASGNSVTSSSTFSFLGNRGFTSQQESVIGEDYKWSARVIYDTQYYGFIKNTSETNLFNPNYCPQLLDENYIRLAFGELDAQATYPLYMSDVDNFKCLYYGDILSGSRYYNILDNTIFTDLGYISINNKYNTAVVATVPNYVDMITDSWKQWWAYNKGALITAIGTTALKMFSSYAFAGVEAAAIAEEAANAQSASLGAIRTALSEGEIEDANMANKAMISGMLSASARSNSAYGRAAARSVSAGTSLVTLASSAINAVFQPNSPKTQGTMWANTYSGKTQIFTIWQRVNDIDECARYFESNGYKVHEVVNNPLPYTQPELPWKRTRYYYDVVSCNNMLLYCNTVMLPAVLEEDLRARFQDGFRAWHCYEGQYAYPLIEDRSLAIGATCVYDNTEV